MPEQPLLTTLVVLLALSMVISALCHRIKLPSIIGYIFVGILVGPAVSGLVVSSHIIHLLAEIGIVFLIFTVGLEFSYSHLLKLKTDVFGYGFLQVVLTILATLAITLYLGVPLKQGLCIAFILAMSSTAIVVKQLSEQQLLHAPASQHAIGILLFQDLAVIPVLILLPNLVANNTHLLFTELLLATLKGVLVIFLIIFIGNRILKPIFYHLTSPHSLELFTLVTLFIALGAAWLTHTLGLSMALGAFLAGILLGETEFRHQIKTDIRPFRDVLIGFFFITIGMQFNPSIVIEAWPWMLLTLFALLFFKAFLIFALGLYFTRSKIIATQTSLILMQGSEFGFAILSAALVYRILPPDYAQVLLGSILLSMAISPILIKYHQPLAKWLFRHRSIVSSNEKALMLKATVPVRDHTILLGYGDIGECIADFLNKAGLKFVALDLDPITVKKARMKDENVFYGDGTHYEILKLANIQHAKAIIISFITPNEAGSILEYVKLYHSDLPIIVRCHNNEQAKLLHQKGATTVIPETLEASLALASQLLLALNIPSDEVHQWVEESRERQYSQLTSPQSS